MAAEYSYETLFSSPKVLRQTLDRIPIQSEACAKAFRKDAFGGEFTEESPRKGQEAIYDIMDVPNTIEHGRPADTEPNTINPLGRGVGRVVPMHFAARMQFDLERFNPSRGLGEPIGSTDNGGSYILRNLDHMKRRMANAFEFMWVNTLLDGFKYEITANNEHILQAFSASGAAVKTVANGVPSSHKAQLDLDGGGDVIDTSWATASADIHAQMLNVDKYAARVSGFPVGEIWMNGTTAAALFTNTKFQTMGGSINPIPRTYEEARQNLTQTLGTQEFTFAGLPNKKVIVYNGTAMPGDWQNPTYSQAIDAANSPPLIPDNRAIFLPDRSTWRMWSGMVSMKRLVLQKIVGGNPEDVDKYHSYSYYNKYPVSRVIEHSHAGIPFLMIPRAVFSPTVIF